MTSREGVFVSCLVSLLIGGAGGAAAVYYLVPRDGDNLDVGKPQKDMMAMKDMMRDKPAKDSSVPKDGLSPEQKAFMEKMKDKSFTMADMLGKKPGGKDKGMKDFTPKKQLVSIIAKIDVLVEPPKFKLTDEQKTKLLGALKDLDTLDKLDDEEAQKRLKVIHDVLKDDKAALEAVGHAFAPPSLGPPTDKELDNPFSEEKLGNRLKAVKKALGTNP